MTNSTGSGTMLISIGSTGRHKVSCPLQSALFELVERLIREALRTLHEASIYCSKLVLDVRKPIIIVKAYNEPLV